MGTPIPLYLLEILPCMRALSIGDVFSIEREKDSRHNLEDLGSIFDEILDMSFSSD